MFADVKSPTEDTEILVLLVFSSGQFDKLLENYTSLLPRPGPVSPYTHS